MSFEEKKKNIAHIYHPSPYTIHHYINFQDYKKSRHPLSFWNQNSETHSE